MGQSSAMRVCATADLHFNHPRSRSLAGELIQEINTLDFDVLLLVGDTATAEGDELERCLSLCTFGGPRLFVAGNHELWSHQADTHELFTQTLPQRVRSAGWHWLEADPIELNGCAFVGSIGWYDYSFAPEHLGVPRRFYAAKVSPGAAGRLHEHRGLLADPSDLTAQHHQIIARWNDGRFIRLGRSDEQFLEERLADLQSSIRRVAASPCVLAAIHHVPFRELLPPPRNASWDFAWAYLGSHRIGQMLLRHANVKHVICGHSHLEQRRSIGHLTVTNIGSSYRHKRYVLIDLPGPNH